MVVRASALLAILVDLVAYYAFAGRLPELSLWGDVAFIALVLIPATLGLVWLCLPARRSRYLLPAVIALIGLAVLLDWQGFDIAANFVKLAAVTGAGWFFLRFFEEISWVLLVALVIIPIDIFSVARGPTKTLIEDKPELFNHLSIGFPVPGQDASAQLGLPDVLFFALFLGAADRFGLRVGWTWVLVYGVVRRDARHQRRLRRQRPAGAPASLAGVRRRERRHPVEDDQAPAGVKSATVSICGVCGNMSTGRARSSRYPCSLVSSPAFAASVVGLHDT